MGAPKTRPGDPPTARQAELFRMIVRHLARCGMPPTGQELATIAGIGSLNGVTGQLRAMAAG
jgi:SOS-response transcriptional repressor LexA